MHWPIQEAQIFYHGPIPLTLVGLANGDLSIFVERFWLTDSPNTITKSVTRGWYSDYTQTYRYVRLPKYKRLCLENYSYFRSGSVKLWQMVAYIKRGKRGGMKQYNGDWLDMKISNCLVIKKSEWASIRFLNYSCKP